MHGLWCCRPDAAAAAQLLVAPGGDLATIQRVKPFLEAHGRLLPLLDTPAQVRDTFAHRASGRCYRVAHGLFAMSVRQQRDSLPGQLPG
jgi:hypothetical protein